MKTFRALLATREQGRFQIGFRDLNRNELPPGEVLVRVVYSSLNYKDGLAVTGRPGVIRKFPMVPGIDFAGLVEESTSSEFLPGDRVVATGSVTSETVWGGYAELARLDTAYLVKVPGPLSLLQAAGIGTAGFAAMHSLIALEEHGLKPGQGEVLVTGAAGGVGSIAVAILANLGYRVAASTGRQELHDYLKDLGAAVVLDRSELLAPGKPLEKQRWAAAIDNVGGATLAGLLRSVAAGGSVALVGVAGGAEFTATVFPFLLRGVALLGIDSAGSAKPFRVRVWERLARDLPLAKLEGMLRVEPLEKVLELGREILEGRIRGRVVFQIGPVPQ